MTPKLFHIPHSPWSLKARFALRHHHVAVALSQYQPLSGELGMRLRLRKLRGRITVPVLFTTQGTYTDSWDIARFAELAGAGSPLIPKTHEAEVASWNTASERLMWAGRARGTVRASRDLDVILENLPALLRRFRMFHAIGRYGLAVFARKYEVVEQDMERHAITMRAELARLREALSGRKYLLGAFSYADVAMALSLQLIDPLPETSMGSAVRRATRDETLCNEHRDLLEWRDALHAEHHLV